MSIEKTGNTDEIDLYKPFVSLVNFFYGTRFVLLIATLAGLAIGMYSYFTTDKVYKSRMTCESAHLADGRVIDLILDLQMLIDQEDYTEVSRLTNIPVAQIKNVVNIEAISFAKLEQESKNDKEALHEAVNSTFGIEVLVKDLDLLPALQKGIVFYLSNNPYAKRRQIEDRKQLESVIASLERQQRRYDSINTDFTQKTLASDKTTLMLGAPYNFKMQVQEIYERILEARKSLALMEEIRVIQEFIRIKKPYAPKLIKTVSTFVVLLNVLVLIVLSALAIGRKLKKLVITGS